MQFISILSIAASALIVVVIYSVRLQRRAIATQERLALEHHEENQKRDRFYASSVPDNAMPNTYEAPARQEVKAFRREQSSS